MSAAPRVVFFGTPAFAVPSLEAIHAAGWDVHHVITQPDKPAGRGQQLLPSPVRIAAERLGIPVSTPTTLRTPNQPTYLVPDLDAALVVAYGKLIPASLLSIPRLGFVNIHPSLLPRWRGASPIQSAIAAGDTVTGISLMQLDEGQDTGPVWQQIQCPISNSDTATFLTKKLAELAADILVQALPTILAQKKVPQPQSSEGVTTTSRLTKESGHIQWQQPAESIARQLRAFTPWPGSWTTLNGVMVKILAGQAQAGPGAVPGVIAHTLPLRIGTGQGVIEVTELQFPGGRPQNPDEAVRGHALLGQQCV